MKRFIPFLMLAATACSQDKESTEKAARPAYTMTVPSPQSTRQRTFSGISKSFDEIILSFRVNGKLVEYPLKQGTHVKKGDVIGKLDTSDFAFDVKKAHATLVDAKAKVEKVKSDYDRTRQLYEGANVSKSILDRDQSLYTSAKSQLDTANTALDIAQQQLSYTILTAPIEGDISETLVANFQTVTAGQPVAKMMAGKHFKMIIGVPELVISQIKLKDPASVTFDSIPNKTFSAVVTEVGVTTSAISTYPVTLTIRDEDPRVRYGMTGEATLQFHENNASVKIPPSAVVGAVDNKNFVWIYQPASQTVTKHIVKTGKLTEEGLEVVSGLNPGDIIVTKGVHHLSEGMKIRKIEA